MPPPVLRLPDATWISRHAPTWREDVTLRSDPGDGQAQTQTYPRSLLVYARPTAGCGTARPTPALPGGGGIAHYVDDQHGLVGTDISSPWAQPLTAPATRLVDRPVLTGALASPRGRAESSSAMAAAETTVPGTRSRRHSLPCRRRPAPPDPAGRSRSGGAVTEQARTDRTRPGVSARPCRTISSMPRSPLPGSGGLRLPTCGRKDASSGE